MSHRESVVNQIRQNPGFPGFYILVWEAEKQTTNQPTSQMSDSHEKQQAYIGLELWERDIASDRVFREGFSEEMSRILNGNS